MHYEVKDMQGNVITVTDNWSELMSEYSIQRKATEEPLHLEKVEDENVFDMQKVH